MLKCIVAAVAMLDISLEADAFPISPMLLECETVERSSQHYSHSSTAMHMHQICGSRLSRGSTCC
ncbi:hypothetical protein LINPERPRIM_LOCUS21403 [Linum perenne]